MIHLKAFAKLVSDMRHARRQAALSESDAWRRIAAGWERKVDAALRELASPGLFDRAELDDDQ